MSTRGSIMGSLAVMTVCTMFPVKCLGGDREEVIAFLKKNVIGKDLNLASTFKLDGGKMETDFQRKTSFADLVETSTGLSFDEIISIRQVVYDISPDGKRATSGREQSRTLVSKHEYSIRKSTGHILGLSRIISNTWGDSIGVGISERINVKSDSLEISGTSVGYHDFFATGGKHEPGSSDFQSIFSIKDGKLQRIQKVISYNIEPNTMQRTGIRDKELEVLEKEAPSVEKQTDHLKGTWQVVSFTTTGERGSDDEAKKYRIEFSDGKFLVTKESAVIQEGTYKTDSSKRPMAVDIAWTRGKEFESKSALGIFEVKEDSLRICFGVPTIRQPSEQNRPKEFASTAESKTGLNIYRRVVKSEYK